MNISVLGSGNGGVALAADWALNGHVVSLFDFEQFNTNIKAINENGGIYCEGDFKGFAKLNYCGHDLEKTLENSDVIFVVGPAYSTEPFALACKKYLKKGQVYIICPSSCCGAVVFKNALGVPLESDEIIVGDTSTLPYACRVIEPGKVKVYLKLKEGLYIASLPAEKNDIVHDIFSEVYKCEKAKNVLQTTLQNGNPVIHPTVTLLNAGRIESTEGDFGFYEDGVTPGVGRLMKSVDEERVMVAAKLGIDIILDAELGVTQGYMQSSDYETGYRNAEGFKGIKAQGQLDHRYLNEDVGFGLVFISELAKKIGVQTPVIDAVILVASKVMNRDYRKEKENIIDDLGIEAYLSL